MYAPISLGRLSEFTSDSSADEPLLPMEEVEDAEE